MYRAQHLPSDLVGGYSLTGSFQIAPSTGSVDVIAARTTTAGYLMSFRWAPGASDARRCYIKRVAARFTCTTAFPTPQEMGCDLIIARSFSAAHTNGTSIDTGSTLTDTGALKTVFASSGMATAARVKVADTNEVTASTQTLDGAPLSVISAWSAGLGDTVPLGMPDGTGGGFGVLWDVNASGYPIVLANNEGIIVRNLILMGATGVGRWDFQVAWDEGVPNPI